MMNTMMEPTPTIQAADRWAVLFRLKGEADTDQWIVCDSPAAALEKQAELEQTGVHEKVRIAPESFLSTFLPRVKGPRKNAHRPSRKTGQVTHKTADRFRLIQPVTLPSDQLLLRPQQLAKVLDVGVRTIWRWTEDGSLPPPMRLGIRGRLVRWSLTVIEEWVIAGCPSHQEGRQADAM